MKVGDKVQYNGEVRRDVGLDGIIVDKLVSKTKSFPTRYCVDWISGSRTWERLDNLAKKPKQ